MFLPGVRNRNTYTQKNTNQTYCILVFFKNRLRFICLQLLALFFWQGFEENMEEGPSYVTYNEDLKSHGHIIHDGSNSFISLRKCCTKAHKFSRGMISFWNNIITCQIISEKDWGKQRYGVNSKSCPSRFDVAKYCETFVDLQFWHEPQFVNVCRLEFLLSIEGFYAQTFFTLIVQKPSC